ncbi:uncharacterized protein LOC143534542 [Bidens hawaiensis]|uniref:uncharacterized protein LOC143534542 n=1 Tax=Bidens hawaiensis TaxID=980011 RepID=UPI004048F3F1
MMSEISRDMNTSTEMDIGMDLFQYYIKGIDELMSNDDFTPSTLKNSRLLKVGSGSYKNREMEKEDNGSNEKNRPVGFSSLFCNAVGNGLLDHRKDRLLTKLCKCVVALNGEVDEMLEPVFSMLRLRRLLEPEKVEFEAREPKRRKVNEYLNVSSGSLTEEGSLSEKQDVVEREPSKSKSLTRCNSAGCGEYAKKTSFDENKSLCGDRSKQGMNESFLGSSSRNDQDNGEVNDAIQFLLENKGPRVVEKLAKYSDEMSATLERMKQKLEKLVDIVVLSCRAMTLAEKHQLKKQVQNLDAQNLDRVAEIMQRGNFGLQVSDDIFIDLQNEENSKLWRLYFYVKTVENARKLM